MTHKKLIAILDNHGVIYTLNDNGQAICIDEYDVKICLSDFNKEQLADWLGY